MSDFFKLAYDLIAKVVYFLVEWVVNFFKGFVQLFITGWADYIAIFNSYFGYFNLPLKILSIILMLILVAIPVVLLILLIRKIVISIQLRAVRPVAGQVIQVFGKCFQCTAQDPYCQQDTGDRIGEGMDIPRNQDTGGCRSGGQRIHQVVFSGTAECFAGDLLRDPADQEKHQAFDPR